MSPASSRSRSPADTSRRLLAPWPVLLAMSVFSIGVGIVPGSELGRDSFATASIAAGVGLAGTLVGVACLTLRSRMAFSILIALVVWPAIGVAELAAYRRLRWGALFPTPGDLSIGAIFGMIVASCWGLFLFVYLPIARRRSRDGVDVARALSGGWLVAASLVSAGFGSSDAVASQATWFVTSALCASVGAILLGFAARGLSRRIPWLQSIYQARNAQWVLCERDLADCSTSMPIIAASAKTVGAWTDAVVALNPPEAERAFRDSPRRPVAVAIAPRDSAIAVNATRRRARAAMAVGLCALGLGAASVALVARSLSAVRAVDPADSREEQPRASGPHRHPSRD